LAQEKLRVIFLVYHGTGHFNACFKLARVLSVRYDVTFAGVSFFQPYVSGQGFHYYPLNTVPFGTGLEYWLNTVQKKKPFYFRAIIDRWNNKLFHLRERELSAMVQQVKPDLILLDAQQSTDFLVLYPLLAKHEICFALLHTMLPTSLCNNIPPLNSLALPENSSEIKKENKRIRRKNLYRRLIQKIKFLWADDGFIIKRSFRQNHIPARLAGGQSSFGFALTGIPELILAPAQFNFREAPISAHQKYLGSCIDFKRIEPADEKYLAQHASILNKLRSENLKLIYCSFGSMPQDNETLILALLKKIIQAAEGSRYLLLISLKFDQEKLRAFQSDRVYIFRQLPQLEILARTDLFITHGGLNSIKESIVCETPMLVYPVEFKTDQPGNSARVVYHQLGLRGEVKKDTVEEIREKINALMANPVYKNNLSAFNRAEKEMDDEKLLSIIQSIPENINYAFTGSR
jgi:zeaxanthin glucosyltransferase